MLQEMLSCPRIVTTYQQHYRGEKQTLPTVQLKPEQPDIQLISNHNRHNLQINGHKVKSEVFPESKLGVEEYRSFLKRLETCKKEIYKLHFQSPDVDMNMIERMLKDLELSTYQHTFSPNAYHPRDYRRYLAKLPEVHLKYYETMYNIYYSRIKELEQNLHALYQTLPDKDKSALAHEMNRYYMCGYSTYYNTYCIPIQENMKKYKLMDRPIDRYTMRKW